MGTDADIQAEIRGIIDAALRGELTETLAARVYELGREATIAFSLAIAAHATWKSGAGPHAPSASIPVYAKPPAGKRRGKPGARDGHEGHRRPTPPPGRVEVIEELKVCPEYTPVLPARRRRRRAIEDGRDSYQIQVLIDQTGNRALPIRAARAPARALLRRCGRDFSGEDPLRPAPA